MAGKIFFYLFFVIVGDTIKGVLSGLPGNIDDLIVNQGHNALEEESRPITEQISEKPDHDILFMGQCEDFTEVEPSKIVPVQEQSSKYLEDVDDNQFSRSRDTQTFEETSKIDQPIQKVPEKEEEEDYNDSDDQLLFGKETLFC